MSKLARAGWILGVLVLSSCGADGRTEVFVSAAASLTESFEAIERAYEEDNPGIDVVLNLAGSSTLREQIMAGAPVDVFASANESVMAELEDGGMLSDPAVSFATNTLEIAVPPGNPASVSGPADFGRAGLVLGLCAPAVPCGDFAEEVLDGAGIDPVIDTYEPNVRALLTKIESGELDAGIVYVTDVLAAAGGVDGVQIPPAANVSARYPIAVLRDADHFDEARAFVEYVLAPSGREILAGHGFGSP